MLPGLWGRGAGNPGQVGMGRHSQSRACWHVMPCHVPTQGPHSLLSLGPLSRPSSSMACWTHQPCLRPSTRGSCAEWQGGKSSSSEKTLPYVKTCEARSSRGQRWSLAILSGFERLRRSQRSCQIPRSSCPSGCPGLAYTPGPAPAPGGSPWTCRVGL